MPRRLLDTSVLCRHWSDRLDGQSLGDVTEDVTRAWALELIDLRGTDAIVSPVEVEFLAGARNSRELRLFRSYLTAFKRIDERRLLPVDWETAEQFASRVPRDGKPRQLGDCLIRALAKRLRCDVDSLDDRFFG